MCRYVVFFVCSYMYEYLLTYITKIIGQYWRLNSSFYFIVWWDVCLHICECMLTYKYIHESRSLNFPDAARKLKGKRNQGRDLRWPLVTLQFSLAHAGDKEATDESVWEVLSTAGTHEEPCWDEELFSILKYQGKDYFWKASRLCFCSD